MKKLLFLHSFLLFNFNSNSDPATFLFFQANALSAANGYRTIEFTWATVQEINCAYFYIQRSIDQGDNFSNIGNSIPAYGPGGSNWVINYSETIGGIQAHLATYRIRSVDVVGDEGYSGNISHPDPGQWAIANFSDLDCDDNYSWALVFEDNFNRNTIDEAKWKKTVGVPRDLYFGEGKALFTGNNVSIDNGILKIIAKQESIQGTVVYNWNPYNAASVSFDYTTGEIYSRQAFQRGKYQINCKLPKGWGFWPAFWMYSATGSDDEIDVFEFWNQGSPASPVLSRRHHMTVHYNGEMSGFDYDGPDYSLDFHVFTVVWDKDKIVWIVDNDIKRTFVHYYTLLPQEITCPSMSVVTPYLVDPLFPMSPMNIIAGFTIQHNNGNDPTSSTPFPSNLEIDYIRYYARINCSKTINECNYHLDNSINSVEVANTIILGDNSNCNAHVDNDEFLTLVATNQIVLKPGFSANLGSSFDAHISECAALRLTQHGNIDIVNKAVEIEQKHLVSLIYPNPSTGVINVKLTNIMSGKMEIYNSYGKRIINKNFSDSNLLLFNLDDYAKGIYLLNLLCDGKVESKKFIIE